MYYIHKFTDNNNNFTSIDIVKLANNEKIKLYKQNNEYIILYINIHLNQKYNCN